MCETRIRLSEMTVDAYCLLQGMEMGLVHPSEWPVTLRAAREIASAADAALAAHREEHGC